MLYLTSGPQFFLCIRSVTVQPNSGDCGCDFVGKGQRARILFMRAKKLVFFGRQDENLRKDVLARRRANQYKGTRRRNTCVSQLGPLKAPELLVPRLPSQSHQSASELLRDAILPRRGRLAAAFPGDGVGPPRLWAAGRCWARRPGWPPPVCLCR